MTPWNVIQELEIDNSRIAKEAIIRRELEDRNGIFFQGVRLALDSLITFGLKQIDEKTDADGPGLSWEDFINVANSFIGRSCTGNSARDAVKQLCQQATVEQWNNWYRRILIKDLRCGVSEKTINKAVKGHPDYMVPVFTCQLAHDSANHEGKVSGKKLIEVKLDGVRVLTVVYPDGRVDQFSRNGKELLNFEHVKRQIAMFANKFNEPVVLDGEIMSNSFQDLMKQVHRKDNVDANDAVLYLFDIIPLADFEKGCYANTQISRSRWLKDWYDQCSSLLFNVNIVGQEFVDLDTPEGDKKLQEINARAIDGGYEGIMIKNPNAPYECKRSVAWLKLKPFIEVSLEVVGCEEGTGRNAGRLGAIVGSGIDDGRRISVNVGSGFSDSDRASIWDSRDAITGDIMEVRADAITQNQDGTYSLRFPRFKCFRGFEHGEKI